MLTLKRYKYCLTKIDRFTHWPVVVPLKEITAHHVAFFNTWISRFGTPEIITIDRESQLESQLFEAFLNQLAPKSNYSWFNFLDFKKNQILKYHQAIDVFL